MAEACRLGKEVLMMQAAECAREFEASDYKKCGNSQEYRVFWHME